MCMRDVFVITIYFTRHGLIPYLWYMYNFFLIKVYKMYNAVFFLNTKCCILQGMQWLSTFLIGIYLTVSGAHINSNTDMNVLSNK